MSQSGRILTSLSPISKLWLRKKSSRERRQVCFRKAEVELTAVDLAHEKSGSRIACGTVAPRRRSRCGLSVESIHLLILLKNPKNASTRLSMNGKSPKILTTPPFVLRFSKDERKVFQQNHLFKPNPTLSNLFLEPGRVARFDLSRFEIDITRPSRIRSGPKIGVRASLFSELAA
jgi:hypothetical protein